MTIHPACRQLASHLLNLCICNKNQNYVSAAKRHRMQSEKHERGEKIIFIGHHLMDFLIFALFARDCNEDKN
jgi:hypothetical protein